ncbi:FecR domain-containing protein [Terrimonas sp. NA20]|uniref:FecR domain-containing protein n=1 Tax=Terrimonas ginsenosidimutans TaxID=2908004 RepID=A0ABS9KM95_9BACT|nr:FecR domain-containing protein [Terrimonas ginsenosidimutans]MCG2613421.1 FecR domain-containing protein [Terrimonas ginsenosidimutans]
MRDNRFLLLVTRKLSGEASQCELQELADLLKTDTSLREEFEIMSRYWQQENQEQTANTEAALQRTLSQLGIEPEVQTEATEPAVKRIPAWKIFTRAAAAVILLGALSVGIYALVNNGSSGDNKNLVQKTNAKGVKSTIALADGSKVWLNADSKLQYPSSFTGNTREVYLNGEAFFDIEKNPSKPFIIHLANGTIRVLGTSFNIKAYDNEPVVETSVATGKVAFIPRLKNNDPADTIFLTPNNKVIYQLKTEKTTTAATSSEEDRAWTEGKLIFRSMLFEEIGIELERNFGKKVVFEDSDIKTYRLTGSFQNNTLSEILYYLSKTKSFSYSVTDEQIVISR